MSNYRIQNGPSGKNGQLIRKVLEFDYGDLAVSALLSDVAKCRSKAATTENSLPSSAPSSDGASPEGKANQKRQTRRKAKTRR